MKLAGRKKKRMVENESISNLLADADEHVTDNNLIV